MPKPRHYLFDGMKAVAIDDLPASAWTFYSGSEAGEQLQTYYKAVPWLFRAVQLRADAVASLPFALVDDEAKEEYDASDSWENKVGFLSDPFQLLWLVEAALVLLNQAYLFREQNTVKTLDLRYLVPTSITPILDKDQGLVAFSRAVGAVPKRLEVDDLVYFWRPDPFTEIGPSENSPAQSALNAAGVLFNVDKFAAEFFKRGAIKATLLTVQGNPPEVEKTKIKRWWERLIGGGVDNAWATEVVSADAIKPVAVGEGISELANIELTKERREDIATALGIPLTLLWSTQASGLGGGGVVQQDDLHFYSKTIVPEATLIAGVLNRQLFEDMGLRWEFRPESLDVFQADETDRSVAFANYVNAGLPMELAGPMLGIELPAGMTWEQLAEEKEKRREEVREQMQQRQPQPPPGQQPPGQPGQPGEPEGAEQEAMRADLRRWQMVARKRIAAGEDPGAYEFKSQFISADLADYIRFVLSGATTEEQVKAAFDSGVKKNEAAPVTALRRRVQKRIQPILDTYKTKIRRAIESGNATEQMMQQFFTDMRAALAPELAVLSSQVSMNLMDEVGVGFDVATLNREAIAWAREYSHQLVTGLTDTTRKLVNEAVSTFASTPGMTRQDLEDLLGPAFGPVRAEMIAVTEVTRAYSQATNQHQQRLAQEGIQMRRIWETLADELVCTICGPLNARPEEDWPADLKGGPPAHVNCRCSTSLSVLPVEYHQEEAERLSKQRERYLTRTGRQEVVPR